MAASTSAVDTTWQADEPGALGIDKILQQVSQDDQDEWEYEYSTTETETYYLTLELSYPEFKDRPAKAPHHSRGGYYKNWLDQYPDGPVTKPIRHGMGQEDQSDNDNENDNEDEPIPEPEADDDLPHLDPMLQSNSAGNPDGSDDRPNKRLDKGKQKASEQEKEPDEIVEEIPEPDNEAMEEIQILDLHSHNPVISYRGRVFEGQWAEVIGTETIMADRKDDDPNPLPALRQLPGGVDILGACSSRILTTEKLPKPKVPEEDSLAAIRKEWNIRIPPGKDRTGERAHQIRFLENLIALKKKKGQTDDVTVYAVDGAGKDFNDKKGPDFKPRKRKPSAGQRLRDDGSSQSIRERRRSARNTGGRGARRRSITSRGAAAVGERSKSPPTLGPGILSTPTPSHWDELSTAREDDENEEEDYDDDDEDGDNSLEEIYEESEGPDGGEETHDDEDVTMEG